MDQENQNVSLVLACLDIQTLFLMPPVSFLYGIVNWYPFLRIIQYILFASVLKPWLVNCSIRYCITTFHFNFSYNFFKLQLWFILSRWQLTDLYIDGYISHFIQMTLQVKNLLLCSSYWILDRPRLGNITIFVYQQRVPLQKWFLYVPSTFVAPHWRKMRDRTSLFFQLFFFQCYLLKIDDQSVSLKQPWIRAEQRWLPLKQSWTALIFDGFRIIAFGLFFMFFDISRSTSILMHIVKIFACFTRVTFLRCWKNEFACVNWPGLKSQRYSAMNRAVSEFRRFSALIQRLWKASALIFSESALFKTDQFSAVSEKISCESALFKTDQFRAASERISCESTLFIADILSCETLVFQRWTALIQRWFTLN